MGIFIDIVVKTNKIKIGLVYLAHPKKFTWAESPHK